MDEDGIAFAGGCACGAVRYVASGAPLWAAHCHCRDCRRTTGAAFATYAGFPAERFAWSGEPPALFESSPGVKRHFCGRCGTPLTYASQRWPGEVHVLVGSMDAPERIAPTGHVYVAEQMPWLHLADGLPRFATTAGQGEPLA